MFVVRNANSFSFTTKISTLSKNKFLFSVPVHRQSSDKELFALKATLFPTVSLSCVTKSFSFLNTNTKLFNTPKVWTAVAAIVGAFIANKSNDIKSSINSAANTMESGWKKRGLGGSFFRTLEIWLFAISYIFKYFKVEKLKKGDPKIYSNAKKEIAIILRDKLLELGPTFIKLGQLLSTRIDVLPREYIDALILLQDQVPGFPGDLAVEIIEREFGRPIDQIYDTFNRTSLAAASLGQVHTATLNGKRLAVKVQRQGLKNLFDMDLKNIKVLAQILDKFDPKSDGAQRDWVSIYQESAKLLYKEINYEAEALNCIRFKENFADVPWVKVPDVYLNLTTQNIVTMEYVPGIKVNDIARIDAAGIDKTLLAKRSAESYLLQLCRYGFFHCDPHPGNVACDAVEGGRLIYYDFGMMDELKPAVKEGLVNLIFGIYENEPKEVCNALEDIEVLQKGVDRLSIEKIVRIFLNDFKSGVQGGKWTNQLSVDEQKEVRRKRRLQLGADLFSVGSDVPFKFPPTFTFVFRAFTSLDGIGKGLDPTYDLTRLAQPFLKELIDLRDGSATLSAVKSVGKKLGWRPVDIANAVTSPRKVAKIEEMLTKMEQGDLKLRVRVLESERSFKRMELVQNNMAVAIAASAFLNVGIVLASVGQTGKQLSLAAKFTLTLAGIFGLQIPIGLLKLKSLDKKFAGLSG